MEHPTFHLSCGHFASELSPPSSWQWNQSKISWVTNCCRSGYPSASVSSFSFSRKGSCHYRQCLKTMNRCLWCVACGRCSNLKKTFEFAWRKSKLGVSPNLINVRLNRHCASKRSFWSLLTIISTQPSTCTRGPKSAVAPPKLWTTIIELLSKIWRECLKSITCYSSHHNSHPPKQFFLWLCDCTQRFSNIFYFQNTIPKRCYSEQFRLPRSLESHSSVCWAHYNSKLCFSHQAACGFWHHMAWNPYSRN